MKKPGHGFPYAVARVQGYFSGWAVGSGAYLYAGRAQIRRPAPEFGLQGQRVGPGGTHARKARLFFPKFIQQAA